MHLRRENFRYIIVLALVLSSPSLLVAFVLSQIGFSSTVFDIFILGSLLSVALLFCKNTYLTSFQRGIQLFLIVLLSYLLVIWNVDIIPAGSQRNIFKVLLAAPLLMIIFNDSLFDLQKFIRYFLIVSFILSLLSLVQYFGVPLGLVSLEPATLRSSMENTYVGLGGFYHYLEFGGVFGIESRNQSFFSEPTNFGQFLNLPLFIAAHKVFGHKTGQKKLQDSIILFTILLAYLLTFSVANFFGLFGGLIFYFFFRINNNYSGRRLARTRLIGFILLVAISFGAYKFYEYTNTFSTQEAIIGKSTSSNLTNRTERNQVYFDRIKDYPFGDIEYKTEYAYATGLIGSIAITGGYPLLGLMLIFFVFYFRKVYLSMKKSKYLLIYCGLISYMLPAIWDAKFYEYYFLFVFVFFSTLMRHEELDKKIV